MYSYDSYGWFSAEEIPGRTTSIEPPQHGDKTVGQPFPNWTGHEWVLATYYEPPAPPAPPEDANAWWIYVGPFYDRFGAQKWPILASTDPMVGALIKDCSVRKYIDLKRADLPGALDLLVAKGFAIDKTAILTTPVPDGERFVG